MGQSGPCSALADGSICWLDTISTKEDGMNRNMDLAIGRAAALSIAIETLIFAFSLIWGVIFHTEFDQNLGYVASLFLAVSVGIMMACFYAGLPEKLKILGLLALAASILYAPFCIGTYFLQLSIVALNPLNLSGEVMKALDFVPGSPTFALDMLGYGFLCLSTLAAGFALTEKIDRVLKVLCFFHGALAVPTVAAPIISGIFRSTGGNANDSGSFVLLFWCVVFTPIALLFMRYFINNQRQQPQLPA
jgi:hypothetical protein